MSGTGRSDSRPNRGRKLEVEISQQGRLLGRVRLRHSPATIGRGDEADVQLDSGHVSRLHARIHFDTEGITLVDAGSTNGFRVRGHRAQEAKVTAGEPVDVAEFVLTFRWQEPDADAAVAEPAPLPSTQPSLPPLPAAADDWASRIQARPARPPVDDWDELDEDAREPDTAIRTVEEIEPEPAARPALDPAIPAGSILNRLVHERSSPAPTTPAADADDEEDDDGPQDEAPPLDNRPMLLALNEEANAQSRAHPYGRVAVEVIRVVNEEVRAVDVLLEGDSSWWGSRPSQLQTLWLVADNARFPMVTHTRTGEYRVQVPHDPSWKMFHRGTRPVDLYRSGPFVGCKAEFEDQVEISCGPFAAYIRCVKLAPKPPLQLRLTTLLPSPQLLSAAAVSLVLHAGLIAMPLGARRWNVTPVGRPDYFVALMRPDAAQRDRAPSVTVAKPPAAEPAAPPAPKPAAEPKTKEPEPERLPPLERPTKRTGGARQPRDRRVEPKPGAADDSPPPPAVARPPLRSVSVSDFKVSGFLENLATPEIDVRGRSGMRSGPAALRGAGPLSAGVVTKGPAGLRTTPAGRLTDAQVKAVVGQHAGEVEGCYNKSLAREPGLAGRVELMWTVNKVGVPTSIHTTYDDVGSPSLVKCLRAVVERWVFPPPKGGDTRVAFPFIFSNLRR